MGGARTIAILLTVAALCAGAISGCGGGDSSTSTATTAEGGSQTESTPAGGSNQAGGGQGSKEGGGSGSGSGGGSGSGNGGSGAGSGGGKAGVERSSSFRTPGGDNSIQEFGAEGDSSSRSEATKIVAALFKALESGDWTEVCGTYLSAGNLEGLKMLSEKSSQLKGKGCAEVLGGLNTSSGSAKSPDAPDGSVASLRTEGEVAFALYRGKDGKGYAVPLKLEGGQYKLTALAPTPLNP